MRVEALSEAIGATSAIGIVSVAPTLSAPTFGGRVDIGLPAINSPMNSINVGGLNNSELNSSLFSMPELQTPTIENTDKVIPGNLAFTHTEILWQAPPTPALEPLLQEESVQSDKEIVSHLELVVEPTLIFDSYDALGNELALDKITEPEAIPKVAIPPKITLQEVEADAGQAFKVEEALIAIGIPEEEAEERAIALLKETLEKKQITEDLSEQSIKGLVELREQNDPVLKEETEAQTAVALQKANVAQTEKAMLPKPKEKFFEKDINADKAREELAKKAIAIAFKKPTFGEKRKTRGFEIAQEMPSIPQPNEVKSEIIQESRKDDGSYVELIRQIAGAGEIYSPYVAEQMVENAIKINPAVRSTRIRSSSSVTIKDVEKVLGKGNVLEIKV